MFHGIIVDLPNQSGVANFRLNVISSPSIEKMSFNFVAAHENHSDDKSKEWGARIRSINYKLSPTNEIIPSNYNSILGLMANGIEKLNKETLKSGWESHKVARIRESLVVYIPFLIKV